MEKIKNKNGFLITCMCCIVLLLTLCYFGINSTFKGTAAAGTQICPNGYVMAEVLNPSYTGASDVRYTLASEKNKYCCPNVYTNGTDGKTYVAIKNEVAYCFPRDNGSDIKPGLYNTQGAEWQMNLYHKFDADELEIWFAANEIDKEDQDDASEWDDGADDELMDKFAARYMLEKGTSWYDKVLANHNKWMQGSGWKINALDSNQQWTSNSGSEIYLAEDGTSMWIDMKVVAPLDKGVAKAKDSKLSTDKVCMQTANADVWKYVTYEEAYKGENTLKEVDSEEECLKNTKYTHIFKPNGGVSGTKTSVTQTYGQGVVITASYTPTRSGYKFLGWSLVSSATSPAYVVGEEIKFTENKTLFAVWEKTSSGENPGGTATGDDTPSKCSLVLNLNGGTLADTTWPAALFSLSGKEFNCGTTVGVPDATEVTRSGYTLKFWGTNTSSTSGYDKNITLNKDVTLYAIWEPSGGSTGTKKFTATFYDDYPKANANKLGSAHCMGTSSCKLPVSNIPTPTKSGYTFDGWRSSASATCYPSTNLYIYVEEGSFYACWKSTSTGGDTPVTEYTVNFNANGGSVSPTAKVAKSGSSITLPTPTRSGYTFNGWYTASSGGSKIGNAGASYTVTKTITLYAHWTVNVATGDNDNPTVTETFTATFDVNGGNAVGNSRLSCTTDSGSCQITGLPTAFRNGYIFKGWGTSQSCTSGNTSTITLTSNKTYYACYVADSTSDDGNNNNDNNNNDNNNNDNNNNNNDNSGNVNENPKTGEIAIALTWFIGLIAVGYSFYYFKNVKQN